MPEAPVFSRVCFGTHDPTPRGFLRRLFRRPGRVNPRAAVGPTKVDGTWWTGEAWFNKYWPSLAQNPGATAYVFCNEWFSNKQPHADVDKFATFYRQLMDACTAHGVTCTIGDFSVGTPGYPTIPDEAYDVPAFQAMLSQAERQGHWLNCHGYDLHQGNGLVPREYTIRRYKTLQQGHPNLKIIAGELANDPLDVGNNDGLYGGQRSLDRMKEFAGIIDIPGCWWLVCDGPRYQNIPEARWDLDDITPIINQYFDWVLTRP